MTSLVTRRGLIAAGSAAAASLVAGCDRISDAPSLRWFLDFGAVHVASRSTPAAGRAAAGARIPRSRYLAGVSAQRDGTPQRP